MSVAQQMGIGQLCSKQLKHRIVTFCLEYFSVCSYSHRMLKHRIGNLHKYMKKFRSNPKIFFALLCPLHVLVQLRYNVFCGLIL